MITHESPEIDQVLNKDGLVDLNKLVIFAMDKYPNHFEEFTIKTSLHDMGCEYQITCSQHIMTPPCSNSVTVYF